LSAEGMIGIVMSSHESIDKVAPGPPHRCSLQCVLSENGAAAGSGL